MSEVRGQEHSKSDERDWGKGGVMYVVTRIWEAKPMEARQAATLAALIGEVYEKAGQRSSVQVTVG